MSDDEEIMNLFSDTTDDPSVFVGKEYRWNDYKIEAIWEVVEGEKREEGSCCSGEEVRGAP